jgi:hypothetical protein
MKTITDKLSSIADGLEHLERSGKSINSFIMDSLYRAITASGLLIKSVIPFGIHEEKVISQNTGCGLNLS